jgi:hypothetical protein
MERGIDSRLRQNDEFKDALNSPNVITGKTPLLNLSSTILHLIGSVAGKIAVSKFWVLN